jgi:hypothetical protein
MRIVNYTKLPDKALAELLAFASRGVRDDGVELHVKNEPRAPHGWCYAPPPKVSRVAMTTRALITLHLPSTPDSPLWPKRWWTHVKRVERIYPERPLDGWRDCVVALGAHEFRHVWQYDRRRRWRDRNIVAWSRGERPTGKKEYDAEQFAIRRLSEYRVATGRTPIVRVKQPNPFARVTA